jgi:hypothetical protein
MKKYFPLITAILFIFSGCAKHDSTTDPVPVTPQITIKDISYPAFINSIWKNVVGGNLVLEFDLKDAKDSVASRIKDSTDLKNIATYAKIVDKGKYDINISAGNPSAVADTFLRFKGQVKSYTVDNKEAVSLTVTSTDGLITIDQKFIKDNTIPTFKADAGPAVYKLGLSNGFYYLYIKNGVQGAISFVSKETGQLISKRLSILTLNQYNMAVVANKGSLQVVFSPFAYNDVPVVSSTLLTLNIIGDYTGNTVYFVATDETGKILVETKYIHGTKSFKLSTTEPFTKDRFNFYEIKISDDIHTVPDVIGYLQVKKGSVYVNTRSYTNPPFSTLKLHLKNASGFDKLSLSTDMGRTEINTLADSSSLPPIQCSNKGKLWVQMLKNNIVTYNFFTIPVGTTDYNLDLSKVTSSPIIKTYTTPGDSFYLSVSAKQDKSSDNAYAFGRISSNSNQLDFYYPNEPFQQYTTVANYRIGELNYTIKQVGTGIPASINTFDPSFLKPGISMANFKPSITGTSDYYFANFIDLTSAKYLQLSLFSPAAGYLTPVKLPDFSKYLGVSSVNLGALLLKQFGLYQADGFNEARFYYDAPGSDTNLSSKSVVAYY